MSDPERGELPLVDKEPPDEAEPVEPRWRLRVLPALAIASMLVAGGLLMAVSGMARIVGPAPPTPIPTVSPSPSPALTPVPPPIPVTPTLGPSASPFG